MKKTPAFARAIAAALLAAAWLAPAPAPAAIAADAPPPARAGGTLPVGADGKLLNLDFEAGTLANWTAEGTAFAGQPVEGDTVAPRRNGMRSNHQGKFWVGGYEKAGDDATGMLTSDPFAVTQRWASFMVAGGSWPQTRVELLTAADGKVFFTARGTETETLRPVVVDLEKQLGQSIRIRLVDQRKGPWGHINFDDFRFHASKPDLPDAIVPAAPPAPADVLKYAGLSPQDAAKAMTLPPGFKSQVFAAEPDIINPIAFAIDARGRLWVAQALTYPIRAKEGEGRDSIIIFEDTDGDGVADKRTVFAEHLNLVSGLEVGFGGVYVGAAPYLMFIPAKDDADGTTRAAGEPQILLDGFGYQDTHETLNSFIWGPDGWLYGCHGVFTQSYVGKPGTPKEQRVHINAGVWRYHPTRKVFERFAEGTSNPWGLDYDDKGQFFAAACVIPHMWHVIQNGRYQRQAGQHDEPYTFDDIKQSADHVHYLGATPHAGNGRSDAAGGGHAHSGLMCYDGDNWPAEYRGKLFMNNIHGARINMDVPEPSGSGYVVHHGKDFLLANDRGSQIINMKVGPDGSVYMIDWYDLQQCHTTNPKDHDRTTGRIFKVSYGEALKVPGAFPTNFNLATAGQPNLVGVQGTTENWLTRHSRQVLQEQAATTPMDEFQRRTLFIQFQKAQDESARLRFLWTIHVSGGVPEGITSQIFDGDQHVVTSWGIRLLCENGRPSEAMLKDLVRLAQHGTSPVVRQALASAVQRLAVEQRWGVLAGLLSHAEDASDHNLPLMYWYGLESVMSADPDRALALAAGTKIPDILTFAARRQAMIGGPKELDGLIALLGKTSADAARADILRGMATGLKGRRGVPAPAQWDAVAGPLAGSADPEVARLVRSLGVVFGAKSAFADATKTALDKTAPAADRLAALDALLAAKAPGLAGPLQQLLDDPAVRPAAVRGLAGYDDPGTPAALLTRYASLTAVEKKDALSTLAARPAYAKALAAEIGKAVPKPDFTADLLRQLRTLNNADVNALLDPHWTVATATDADKAKKITALKKMLDRDPDTFGTAASATAPPVSASRGRLLFNKTCAGCHTLFGEGGKVGPDITGSDRANLDYLLTNVVDPNALIPADYRAWTLDTKDDQTIVGILKKDEPQAVTLQTATQLVTVQRSDIAKLKASPFSMMPEGLLDPLPEADVRDLVAYLRSPAQVPALADADAAKTLFNGKDLTGWESLVDDLYTVEDGQIVGRSKTGLKKNQFLTSKLAVRDFRLVVKMKLTPDSENSGVQFRSVRLPNSHEMKGTQADAGQGWWGKLYEESGRGLLFPKTGEAFDATPFLKKNDWNTYEVLAVGGRIKTTLNGHLCTDLVDDQVAKEGIFGLQLHQGGPIEVRWKDFELEVDPKFELKTVGPQP